MSLELWFLGLSLASPQGVLGVIWAKVMSKLRCEILSPHPHPCPHPGCSELPGMLEAEEGPWEKQLAGSLGTLSSPSVEKSSSAGESGHCGLRRNHSTLVLMRGMLILRQGVKLEGIWDPNRCQQSWQPRRPIVLGRPT